MPVTTPHLGVRALVAYNLQRLLAERGLTVHAAAALAGVDRSNLYSVLRYEKGVTTDILGHVADGLGVHIVEFFVAPPRR